MDAGRKEGRAMAVKAVVGKASPDATVALRVAADAVPDSAKEYPVQATGKTLQCTFVQKTRRKCPSRTCSSNALNANLAIFHILI